jgi:hypothetical protein
VLALFCGDTTDADDDDNITVFLLSILSPGENRLLLLLLFRKVGEGSGTILGENEGEESIEELDVGEVEGS